MDFMFRRTSCRLPGVVALLTLTILSILFIASPISSESSLSQVHRRSIPAPPLRWRQEDPPASTPDPTSTGETITTTPTSTSSTTSATPITPTTSTSTTSQSTSTTPTRTATSTRSTSTPSTTQTSSTSASTTGTTASSSALTTSHSDSSTSSGGTPQTTASSPGSVSGTTLVIPPDFVPGGSKTASVKQATGTGTDGVLSSTPTAKAESTGASKKSFWDNKGAVAGVFVVISLFALGLLAFFWRAFARRRAVARQKRLTAQLFGGKYAESEFNHSNNHGTSDLEDPYGGGDSRFQGGSVSMAPDLYEADPYAATSSNPWSPPPVAPTSQAQPHEGTSTGYQAYQPPHSAASTYETAQSNYYTSSDHSHHANIPAVTVTAPQHSAPSPAYRNFGGAGDRASYDSFYGGKAV